MSEDQVTHTPTPWVAAIDDDEPEMVEITTEDRMYRRMIPIAEVEIDFDDALDAEQRANAEFIVLAVNSHDALTAHVAELEAENERLREALGTIDKNISVGWIDNSPAVRAYIRAVLKPEA